MFSRVASEMSLVHNMVIRGLNSIYLQAPRVSQNDVPSFLQYALAWWALVNVHHTGEETDFFPYLEDVTGQKGLMDVNVDQHHAFGDGLQRFKTYMEDCVAGKQKFEGNKVVGIIDEFGEVLVTHLTDEIPTLLQLREVGMEKLGGLEKQFGLEGEKNMVRLNIKLEELMAEFMKLTMPIQKLLGLVQGLPFCFCNHDVQYEDGKWASWPPAPRIVHILARHVTYWVHRDRWKFAACDRYGHLRPLHCLSQEKA